MNSCHARADKNKKRTKANRTLVRTFVRRKN